MHGFFTRLFLKLTPAPLKRGSIKLASRSGVKNCEKKLAITTFGTIVLFIIITFLYIYTEIWQLICLVVASPFIFYVTFYFILFFKAESRKSRIEEFIPDMLQLVAANLRSGMTLFHALRLAARDDFGELKREIEKATIKALGTESFSEALIKINKNIESKILERALQLFVTALKSGGKAGKILNDIAKDISETRALKREFETNTKTYTMFILFIVVIGTPFLLTVSLNFLGQITALQAKTGDVGFGMSFLMGNIQVGTEFMFYLSLVMLAITSLSASSLVGVIKTGSMKHGVKYFPLLAVISIVIFFAANIVLTEMGFFSAF